MQKTFKIGEYCLHGIIKVVQDDLKIKVLVLDWNSKKVMAVQKFHVIDKHKVYNYLEQFTTCFYADKIINHFYS